jgi:8-oxo-dGTP pyrophosphatase MutT (NUDIX family)
MSWEQEVSAGGVVVKKEAGKLLVLIIKPSGQKPNEERWQLPKGLVGDKDTIERFEQAALREVREEGGVDAKVLSELTSIHYFYQWKGKKISKTVHWYLMEYVSGDVADHDWEVEEARFVPVQKALEMLSYESERKVVRQAFQQYQVSKNEN